MDNVQAPGNLVEPVRIVGESIRCIIRGATWRYIYQSQVKYDVLVYIQKSGIGPHPVVQPW